MKDYLPILVSMFSVLIAAVALGWNVYRDVFSKARVRVAAGRSIIHRVGQSPLGPFLSIDVTNMGPGPLKIDMIVYRNVRRWLKPLDRSGGIILYDWENPLSPKLPAKIEPGDRINLLLGWSGEDDKCVFKHPFGRLGVSDSFGRSHWVPRKDIRHLRKKY